MPKAKTAPSNITKVAKTIVNKAGKALKVKAPAAKGPAVKVASKPIKKASKTIAAPAKPPTFKRPSAPPKKPMSAYLFFNAEMQSQMKNMAKFKAMPFMQRNQVVAQSWSKLDDEQKKEYNKCAIDDKKRFDKETKQLEKKGYFVNKDGKDSRDLYKAPKKSSEDKEMKDDSPKKKSAKDRKSEEMYSDDVVKPKRPMTSFMFFSMDNRAKVLKSKPDMAITEIAKQNGEDWKKLTEQQKKKYDALNKKDQERHQKEMKEFEKNGFFTNSDGVSSKFLDKKHRVQEFEKGTVMPKKANTAYMFYFSEQQNLFKSQMKEGEKFNCTENTKKISESWSAMTAQKKAKYEKMNQQDQERHDKQLSDLRKNGFFTTEDGVKSTDLPAPKPKKAKKPKRPDASVTKE